MSQTALFCEKPNHHISEFEFLQDPKDKNAKLGVGSFATVKLAREKKTNKPIALKMVDLETSKSKAADLHNLRTEVFIHRRIDHSNIIKYHGYMQEGHCIYIILDYAERGNLYSYIHKRKSLTTEEVFRFFHQTCLAVQYLHRHDIMHRDIKPENLLLDKDLNIKLCDFGWAAERIKDKRTTFCGTYEYMAPEIVHKRPYDYHVDIWSLGILLYELIHREAPYKGRSLSEIWNSFSKGNVTYSPTMDPHAKDLIQKILKIHPSDRPSIAQILAHPYIKQHVETTEQKEAPGSAYASVRKEKLDKTAEKENQNDRLHSQDTERPMTSAENTHKKSKKPSGWQPLHPHPVEAIKRKPTEEQNSEHSGRTHTKSSGSLAKTILETSENEEKKSSHEQHRKRRIIEAKGLSPNLKRSLQSIVSPPNRVTPPDQALSEVLAHNGGGSLSGLLENFSAYGCSSVKGTYVPGGHHSVTSATLLGRIGTPSTMTHSATTSNSHTPVIPDNFRAFAPTRKVRTLTTSHTPTNSRPFFGSNVSIPHTSSTATTRAPSHQKTLTVINEGGLPKRVMTENHGSASTRAIYKGSRHLISPRVFETSVSNYDSVKELAKDIGSLVSPVGWTRRKLVHKGNSELSDVSKDEAGLRSFGNYESVMNMRPQKNEEKGNNSQEKEGFVPIINFEKFVKGGDYKPRNVLKGKENGNASLVRAQAIFAKKMKGHNKENKSEDERKMKNMLSLQKLYTPRDIQIQWGN